MMNHAGIDFIACRWWAGDSIELMLRSKSRSFAPLTPRTLSAGPQACGAQDDTLIGLVKLKVWNSAAQFFKNRDLGQQAKLPRAPGGVDFIACHATAVSIGIY